MLTFTPHQGTRFFAVYGDTAELCLPDDAVQVVAVDPLCVRFVGAGSDLLADFGGGGALRQSRSRSLEGQTATGNVDGLKIDIDLEVNHVFLGSKWILCCSLMVSYDDTIITPPPPNQFYLKAPTTLALNPKP